MNTALAESLADLMARIDRAAPGPIFAAPDRMTLVVRQCTIQLGDVAHTFADHTPVEFPDLVAGTDYFVRIADGRLVAGVAENAVRDGLVCGADLDGVIGGFHYAPGGNAAARAGGDDVPAINPHSCWDIGFRPACDDPRGMTHVAASAGGFWCDIYLLGCRPFVDGSSRHGVQIADGDDTPSNEAGEAFENLDHPTATKIFAALGKQLLSPEEFFTAAFGVTEGTSLGRDPKTTGLDAPRTSKWGLMQATGNMSTWGQDGDPDGSRLACRFGGHWVNGEFAGSRCAHVDDWPDNSLEWVGARGRSDHLEPV